MESTPVIIRAPSRLHFGLFSFGGSGRQYGGVGVMIEQPMLQLQISPARQFETCGPLQRRVRDSVERWATASGLAQLPQCRVNVLASPPQHVGLGSGTQLALSLAAGLTAFSGRAALSAEELVRMTGRGQRSAVGTYGFLAGGMIVERGRLQDDLLAPIDARLAFPEQWRFVLIRPSEHQSERQGLSGTAERQAFSKLPPVPDAVRQCLINEMQTKMLPAVERQDLAALGESIFRYGRIAGECFAEVQGGPYNGPRLAQLVEQIRGDGVQGVGQSSWGPTIFALVASQDVANQLVHRLTSDPAHGALHVSVTAVCNRGATVERDATRVAPREE